MNSTPKKKHADFQDPYRRSSNFNRLVKKERFTIDDNGDLHLDKDIDERS